MREFLRAILEELARLARSPETRVAQWSEDEPIDWKPTEVTDPRTGSPFTEAGAWEYVAEQFEAGHPVNVMKLERPPDKVAYTMNVVTPAGKIYVKVRMGNGVIIGRSFHYSIHE